MGFGSFVKGVGKGVKSAASLPVTTTQQVAGGLGLTESSAERTAKEGRELFADLQTPELQSLALQSLESVGDPRDFLTLQGETELAGIETDPALRAAQLSALGRLGQVAEGGLTPEDQAAIDQIAKQEAITERGQREAIIQRAAERGIGGSGLEVAQQLAAQQGTADRAASRDVDVARLAQSRALQAVRDQGALAGNIRGQEFGEQAQVRSAQDIINRFNVGQQSAAGQRAFEEKQRIADANVGTANQAQQLENQRRQQQFENELTRRQAQAGALGTLADQQRARGDRLTQVISATAESGGKVIAGG